MSRSSTKRAEESFADEPHENPLRPIAQVLERVYGVPELDPVTDPPGDPLDILIDVILSQATTNANSDRTFAALKKRYPTWEQAARAKEETIADTIRLGGLANQKAKVIKNLLQQIEGERGSLDLRFLHQTSSAEAVNFLRRFRGIGPKTIACTLLFACQKDVFPLDTHIFRILRRTGLIPRQCSDERAHQLLNGLVPAGKFYSLHVNLIRLGREICKPREPGCRQCPIVEYCDYGRSRL